jgi:hypothetical protein
MPRKPIELPPAAARAFVRDMNAYFAETNLIKRDEIAVRQLVALNEYLGCGNGRFELPMCKDMFLQMRDQATCICISTHRRRPPNVAQWSL